MYPKHGLFDHIYEAEEKELQWLEDNTPSDIHKIFISEFRELKNLMGTLDKETPKVLYKMIYVHAITLLESFLGDTIKVLIQRDEKHLVNAIEGIDELKKAKFSFKDIIQNGTNEKNLVINELSKILFHNIPKVKSIYEVVLGTKISCDISEITQLIKVRHDLVHRNGKKLNGSQIKLKKRDLTTAIKRIEDFVKCLQEHININSEVFSH